MSPRRTLVVATAVLGFVLAGSAAGAVPSLASGHPGRDGTELRETLRAQFEHSFTGIKLPRMKSAVPGSLAPAANAAAAPAVDPFPGLTGGEFAAYASATVDHTDV